MSEPEHARSSRNRRLRARAAVAAVVAVTLAPIVAAKMPPIMDFPNHLTRIWLMSGAAATAPLNRFYQISLQKAGANVGVDLAAAALARLLPIFVVAKCLVALAFLGPLLGGLILNRRLSGRWHPLQWAFLALTWSTTAIAGFVNFQISLGLALALAAVSARARDAATANFARDVLFSALLLCVHPFGVALYAAAVFALRLGPTFSQMFRRQRQAWLLRAALLQTAAAAAPAILVQWLLQPPARAPWPVWGDVANIVDPVHFLTIWLSPILSYNLTVDLACAAPVAALVGYALAAGVAKPHAGLTLAAGALLALAPVAPDAIGDGSWLPQRLPIMAALLLLAGLTPRAPARAWLPFALALPVLIRAGWIAWVWQSRQADIAALDATMRAIAPGASVVTLQQEPLNWRAAPTGRFMIGSPNGVRPTGRHLGALAVIARDAFVPTLFSVPGQQALVIAPEWRDIAVQASSIPYPRELGLANASDPYLQHWRAHFDYVLLLNADLPARSDFAAAVRAKLTPAADNGFARLYKVIKPALTPSRD